MIGTGGGFGGSSFGQTQQQQQPTGTGIFGQPQQQPQNTGFGAFGSKFRKLFLICSTLLTAVNRQYEQCSQTCFWKHDHDTTNIWFWSIWSECAESTATTATSHEFVRQQYRWWTFWAESAAATAAAGPNSAGSAWYRTYV